MTDNFPKIDEIDVRLIELTKKNPDHSIKSLAALLETSERMVLYRLKKLSGNNVLHITYQWDVEEVGFNVSGFVFVNPGENCIHKTIEALDGVEEIIMLSKLTGAADLLCFVVSRNHKHFESILDRIRFLRPSISIESVEILSEVIKFPYGISGPRARLGSWPTQEHFSPRLDIDQTDYDIVHLYQTVPFISRRQVAKKLGISEAIAKNKLEKLLEKRVIYKVTLVSRIAYGFSSTVFAKFQVQEKYIEKLIETMEKTSNVIFVVRTIGTYNMLVGLIGDSIEAIVSDIHEIIGIFDGNIRYTIAPVISGHKGNRALGFTQHNAANK